MRATRRRAKTRSTPNKRLAKLATPQERIRALLRGDMPATDAARLVEHWQVMLALVRLDELCGEESAAVGEAIVETCRATWDSLAPAIVQWDAGFFEELARAMRCASKRASKGGPDKRRIVIEQGILAGLGPSEIARRLTKGQPAHHDAELRQVRRIFRQLRQAS